MPERFERLLAMNTAFGTGQLSEGFRAWRDYSNRAPDLPVGALIARGDAAVTPAEAAAYDAPFPDASFKAALQRAVRGAPPLFEVPEAGHFAQERGVAIVAAALAAWGLAQA